MTILVSNRIVDPAASGAITGGLAAALASAVKDSGATWLGGSGKFHTQRGNLPSIAVTSFSKGELATVDFLETDYRQFYNGMSNAALWPILHYRPDLLRYEPAYLESYRAINKAMADAVCRLAKNERPIWVHDYHYFMLGRYLRMRGMTGPIGFFLHTPFPHRTSMVCLPSHREVMQSLSAYDVIGFQTDDDLLNFREYAIQELFATPVGRTDLRFAESRVQLGVFPIGIDVDQFAKSAESAAQSRALARLRGVLGESKLVIGVDRLDYSKGLPSRLHAYSHFFEHYPEQRKRVSFLQITPPTRTNVAAYRAMRQELASIAGDINARFGDADWVALRYIHEGFSPERLAGYYRLAKIGCVTPLRDGMNLVAKEYVASQDAADPGVLVLSIFAGAAKQLGAALLVNPYDTGALAARLDQALHMSLGERTERWRALMQTLRGADLQAWYTSFIAALTEAALPAPLPFTARHVA